MILDKLIYLIAGAIYFLISLKREDIINFFELENALENHQKIEIKGIKIENAIDQDYFDSLTGLIELEDEIEILENFRKTWNTVKEKRQCKRREARIIRDLTSNEAFRKVSTTMKARIIRSFIEICGKTEENMLVVLELYYQEYSKGCDIEGELKEWIDQYTEAYPDGYYSLLYSSIFMYQETDDLTVDFEIMYKALQKLVKLNEIVEKHLDIFDDIFSKRLYCKNVGVLIQYLSWPFRDVHGLQIALSSNQKYGCEEINEKIMPLVRGMTYFVKGEYQTAFDYLETVKNEKSMQIGWFLEDEAAIEVIIDEILTGIEFRILTLRLLKEPIGHDHINDAIAIENSNFMEGMLKDSMDRLLLVNDYPHATLFTCFLLAMINAKSYSYALTKIGLDKTLTNEKKGHFYKILREVLDTFVMPAKSRFLSYHFVEPKDENPRDENEWSEILSKMQDERVGRSYLNDYHKSLIFLIVFSNTGPFFYNTLDLFFDGFPLIIMYGFSYEYLNAIIAKMTFDKTWRDQHLQAFNAFLQSFKNSRSELNLLTLHRNPIRSAISWKTEESKDTFVQFCFSMYLFAKGDKKFFKAANNLLKQLMDSESERILMIKVLEFALLLKTEEKPTDVELTCQKYYNLMPFFTPEIFWITSELTYNANNARANKNIILKMSLVSSMYDSSAPASLAFMKYVNSYAPEESDEDLNSEVEVEEIIMQSLPRIEYDLFEFMLPNEPIPALELGREILRFYYRNEMAEDGWQLTLKLLDMKHEDRFITRMAAEFALLKNENPWPYFNDNNRDFDFHAKVLTAAYEHDPETVVSYIARCSIDYLEVMTSLMSQSELLKIMNDKISQFQPDLKVKKPKRKNSLSLEDKEIFREIKVTQLIKPWKIQFHKSLSSKHRFCKWLREKAYRINRKSIGSLRPEMIKSVNTIKLFRVRDGDERIIFHYTKNNGQFTVRFVAYIPRSIDYEDLDKIEKLAATAQNDEFMEFKK